MEVVGLVEYFVKILSFIMTGIIYGTMIGIRVDYG